MGHPHPEPHPDPTQPWEPPIPSPITPPVPPPNPVETYAVGDIVCKRTGYLFESEVVAVFKNKNGDTRLVCESIAEPGLLHIFTPIQMTRG